MVFKEKGIIIGTIKTKIAIVIVTIIAIVLVIVWCLIVTVFNVNACRIDR